MGKLGESSIVGNFGEVLVTLCLRKILPGNIPVHWVGHSADKYDIEIPIADGKLFKKPTLISVKTRITKNFKTVPPSKKSVKEMRDLARKINYEFWIGLVLYKLENHEISFGIYLVNSNLLKDEDYKNDKKQEIYFKSLKDKVEIRITSKNFSL
jgi:translation elongation factor EF-1beta